MKTAVWNNGSFFSSVCVTAEKKKKRGRPSELSTRTPALDDNPMEDLIRINVICHTSYNVPLVNSLIAWRHVAWAPCRPCLIRSRIYFLTTKRPPWVNQTHLFPCLPFKFFFFFFLRLVTLIRWALQNFTKNYNEPNSKHRQKRHYRW